MSLYDKLRKRYHSQSGMYINKKTCADLDEFINQRVIEELENVFHNSDYATDIALHHRLQELKQELKTK